MPEATSSMVCISVSAAPVVSSLVVEVSSVVVADCGGAGEPLGIQSARAEHVSNRISAETRIALPISVYLSLYVG